MLHAAQHVIVECGLDACTIDEVSRESGVAKTTIYRHFKNADELALSAIDSMIADIVAPDTGSLRSDLRAVVYGFRRVLEHPSARKTWVTLLSRALDDADFEGLYVRTQELRHAALRRVLQRAMARGEVDPEIDIDQAMYFTQGPFVAKRFVEFDELTDADIDVFVELVCRALAPH
jgi:AcrR family transcriptional regulator